MSKIRAIRTEVDYRDARARIAALADAEDGTPEAYERDILSDLVELYEARPDIANEPAPSSGSSSPRSAPISRPVRGPWESRQVARCSPSTGSATGAAAYSPMSLARGA